MTLGRATRFGFDPITSPDDHIWQGMLLKHVYGDEKCFVFVLSADCDLLHDKGQGEVLVLDAIPIEKYTSEIILPAVTDELTEFCVAAAREIAVNRNQDFSKVGDDAFVDWVCSRDAKTRQAELPGLHADEEKWLEQLARQVKALKGVSPGCEGNDLQHIENSKKVLKMDPDVGNNKSRRDKLEKKFRQAIEGKLAPGRTDIYLLPNIPGANSALGYIVPFKSIRAISRANVTSSISAARIMQDGYIPHANCRPVLTYSLMQKFSMYLNRIGLTSQFEADQKVLVGLLVEEMFR